MIAYDLQCANGHRFEGWFEDAKAFEAQQEKGLIACPTCNETEIARLPSTFAIKGFRSDSSRPPRLKTVPEAEIMARAIIDYVEHHFENVGTDFAKEALKIHYGVSEPRNIRGTSTAQEEETLKQEGVEFVKVPIASPSGSNPSSSEPDA